MIQHVLLYDHHSLGVEKGAVNEQGEHLFPGPENALVVELYFDVALDAKPGLSKAEVDNGLVFVLLQQVFLGGCSRAGAA